MAILKSAKKALRQNVKRRARNLVYKRKIKDVLKKAKTAADLPQVYKTLDKAAKVGVIKKNKASRLKSRLAKSLK